MSRDDKPVNRRRFFREGLRELLKPLAQAIEPLEKVTRELSKLDDQYSPPAPVCVIRDSTCTNMPRIPGRPCRSNP